MRSPTATLNQILRLAEKSPSLKKKGPAATPWQVEIQLLGPAFMAELNFKYRKKKGPTDVLSFPAPSVFRRQGILGELLICESVAKKQAKTLKHSLDREIQILIVHGVLHLLGFDHEKSLAKAKKMQAQEKRLLARLCGKPSVGLIARQG